MIESVKIHIIVPGIYSATVENAQLNLQIIKDSGLIPTIDLGSAGVDGEWGSNTSLAIQKFQSWYNITYNGSLRSDGILDRQTLDLLQSEASNSSFEISYEGTGTASYSLIIKKIKEKLEYIGGETLTNGAIMPEVGNLKDSSGAYTDIQDSVFMAAVNQYLIYSGLDITYGILNDEEEKNRLLIYWLLLECNGKEPNLHIDAITV